MIEANKGTRHKHFVPAAAAYPYADKFVPRRHAATYRADSFQNGNESMGDPELLRNLRERRLPEVRLRDQVVQVGVILGIVLCGWLIWR
ncbi:hypothetical protein [Dechloromonas sp. H13]|uniref:hypothetical protein n=1 Tax=Dechloromonas sp. H13 TaxID=2570193 RepID=UPI001884C92A|nr:hypothetical protein [Dechloromonas sp. H13]